MIRFPNSDVLYGKNEMAKLSNKVPPHRKKGHDKITQQYFTTQKGRIWQDYSNIYGKRGHDTISEQLCAIWKERTQQDYATILYHMERHDRVRTPTKFCKLERRNMIGLFNKVLSFGKK